MRIPYSVQKKAMNIIVNAGEELVMGCVVPMAMDFATNKVYPYLCEKWDEATSKKNEKHHEKKVVKFNKRHAG